MLPFICANSPTEPSQRFFVVLPICLLNGWSSVPYPFFLLSERFLSVSSWIVSGRVVGIPQKLAGAEAGAMLYPVANWG